MTTPFQQFEMFEDDLEQLLIKHFPDAPLALRATALSVALGDLIGARSKVSISTAVELVTKSIQQAAETQRRLAEEIARHAVPGTTTRQ